MERTNHFNTTEFTNEQFSAMLDAGYTVKQIEQLNAQLEYRKNYNARPEVKAKRAEYNKARNARLAEMKKLLK